MKLFKKNKKHRLKLGVSKKPEKLRKPEKNNRKNRIVKKNRLKF